ncbi:MAG TPA: hypothetical protein VFA07_02435 [Chthonomonadaceae bacterium]|nr:hypothetical protein [Chthonomonadaceae bacterium]
MSRKTASVFGAALVCFCLLGCANKPQSVTYLKTHALENEGKTIRVRGQIKSIDPSSDTMVLWDGPQGISPPEIEVNPCPQGVDKDYVVDVQGEYNPEQSKLSMSSCKVVQKPSTP